MPSNPDRSSNQPIQKPERRNAIHSRHERRNAIYTSQERPGAHPDRSGQEPIQKQERRNAIHSRQERRNAIYIRGSDHARISATNPAGRERRNEADACGHFGRTQPSTGEAAVASVWHSEQFSVVRQSDAPVRQPAMASISDDAAATTSGTTITAPVAAQNPARNVHPAASTTCNTAAVARNTTTAAEDDSPCAAEASGFGRHNFGAGPTAAGDASSPSNSAKGSCDHEMISSISRPRSKLKTPLRWTGSLMTRTCKMSVPPRRI